jgi:hypothetical protein
MRSPESASERPLPIQKVLRVNGLLQNLESVAFYPRVVQLLVQEVARMRSIRLPEAGLRLVGSRDVSGPSGEGLAELS